MCLFFPKGDKAKYGNKDFNNRLRIVASSIKSNGCYDRKYVNALVPCEFCGELIEVRLSYSQLFNRRGLHKANHRRLTPYQGSLRDRHEIRPDQWDYCHHIIHGKRICCPSFPAWSQIPWIPTWSTDRPSPRPPPPWGRKWPPKVAAETGWPPALAFLSSHASCFKDPSHEPQGQAHQTQREPLIAVT